MRYVPFDPKQLDGQEKIEWEKLEEDGRTARDELIASYHEVRAKDPVNKPKLTFKTPVYSAFKNHIKDKLFHGKCAYCEIEISGYHPEAEHYRPKNGVTIKNKAGKLEKIQATYEDGRQRPHPGYFWLAYDWYNLVPSCHFCNADAEGKKAKGNQFPLSPGKSHQLYCKDGADQKEKPIPLGVDNLNMLDSQELDALEEPLLLHPYRDEDMTQHLDFDSMGMIIAKTEKGKATRDLCLLDREELNTKRRKTQRTHYFKVLRDAAHWMEKLGDEDKGWEKALSEAKAEVGPETEFSSAVLARLENIGPRP